MALHLRKREKTTSLVRAVTRSYRQVVKIHLQTPKPWEMPKYVTSYSCSSYYLCIKPARKGWVLKQNLNVALPADSRHRAPKNRHHCKGLSCSWMQTLCPGAEQPVFHQPGSPGRTAQGCADISQVTTLLQCLSYLEASAK